MNFDMKIMHKAFTFFLPILFALGLSSCEPSKPSKLQKRDVVILTQDGSSVALKVEIADTFESRQNGFMFRKKIPDGTGMLFVFDSDQILNFWMKNTPTPLSIAYITSDGRIRDMFDMTPYSLADVSSTGYVRYALEVPQGWYKKNGVRTGDRLVMDFK